MLEDHWRQSEKLKTAPLAQHSLKILAKGVKNRLTWYLVSTPGFDTSAELSNKPRSTDANRTILVQGPFVRLCMSRILPLISPGDRHPWEVNPGRSGFLQKHVPL